MKNELESAVIEAARDYIEYSNLVPPHQDSDERRDGKLARKNRLRDTLRALFPNNEAL